MSSAHLETHPLGVLIVDNHPIMRGGLAAVIANEPDMHVVGQADDGLRAIEDAVRLRPDAIVMDLSMPGLDGIEATRQIMVALPEARVLMLSAHREPSNVQSALEAGAVGYVLKRTAARDLVIALRAIAAGGTFLDPSIAAHVVTPSKGTPDPPALSQREAEVLRLIARGYAMKEIAAALDVSARTLETYKTRAMDKLGFKSRPDIVRYAVERGWLRSI